MGAYKFNMKNKKSLIDKYGLCLNEYRNNYNNAKVYYKRAIGLYDEMETSKAMAKMVSKFVKTNDKILDVGCASGHFYRSLEKKIKKNFFYTGIDPYKIFLKYAKKAWKNKSNVDFLQGNIYELPISNKAYDISFCSNVFIHLNDIIKPLKEIIRVTKKVIIIRTVLFETSYKIQLVYNNKWWRDTNVKPVDEFDLKGNPRAYSYFNILSFDYINQNIKKILPNSKITFIKDKFFNKKIINNSHRVEKRPLATKIIGDEQVSGCILQPHYFVIIEK